MYPSAKLVVGGKMTTVKKATPEIGETVWVIDQYPMMGQESGSDPFPGQAIVAELCGAKLWAMLKRNGIQGKYSQWWPDKESCQAHINNL